MHLVKNAPIANKRITVGQVWRKAVQATLSAFQSAWSNAFPMPSPTNPDAPPNIAKAAMLYEGALLAERTDAVSKKRIA